MEKTFKPTRAWHLTMIFHKNASKATQKPCQKLSYEIEVSIVTSETLKPLKPWNNQISISSSEMKVASKVGVNTKKRKTNHNYIHL